MPRIYSSPYPEAAMRSNESFWQYIMRHNIDDTNPHTLILQEHERPEKAFTYASARTAAGLGADALRDVLGLAPGSTILIVGKNSLDYLAIEFAALWLGVVAAFGNPASTAKDLAHFISIAEPDAIFCDPGDVMANMTRAMDDSAHCRKRRPRLIGIGHQGTSDLTFPSDFIKDTGRAHSPPLDLSRADNHKTGAVICFSSGTSGLPKGAMISHYNLIGYLSQYRATEPTTANSDQRDVFYAPLGHIYGVFAATLPLLTGGYVRLLANYSLNEYIKACVAVRATTLRMVPATLVSMVKDPYLSKQDLSSVQTIVCAGAILAPDIITEVDKMMGTVNIVQGYGMTEGSITFLRQYSAVRKQGSVGQPIAGVQLRIVDDDLNDVPEGESGEILFTAKTAFMGYKNNDAANKEAFPYDNSWLRTGDVGRMDSEGYLWLTDRKKDLIKYKGNQVTPAELENVLHSHPLVTEAGVCGVWHDGMQTEVPVGYVSLQASVRVEDRDKVLKEVLDFVNSKVSRNKKMRGGLFYLDKMPRNATGKLMRRELPARRQAPRMAKL